MHHKFRYHFYLANVPLTDYLRGGGGGRTQDVMQPKGRGQGIFKCQRTFINRLLGDNRKKYFFLDAHASLMLTDQLFILALSVLSITELIVFNRFKRGLCHHRAPIAQRKTKSSFRLGNTQMSIIFILNMIMNYRFFLSSEVQRRLLNKMTFLLLDWLFNSERKRACHLVHRNIAY